MMTFNGFEVKNANWPWTRNFPMSQPQHLTPMQGFQDFISLPTDLAPEGLSQGVQDFEFFLPLQQEPASEEPSQAMQGLEYYPEQHNEPASALQSQSFTQLDQQPQLPETFEPQYPELATEQVSEQFQPQAQLSEVFEPQHQETAPEQLSHPNSASVRLDPSTAKTRAEIQVAVRLVLGRLDERFRYICFADRTLAHPKQEASSEEREDRQRQGDAVHLSLFPVCASAIEQPDQHQQALRRARGEEPLPPRNPDVAASELDKSDPAHPQNGGEVLICPNCQQRELKRFTRSTKNREKTARDAGWSFQNRTIMIDGPQYKRLDPADSSHETGIGFKIRIACYCRHQKAKSYRIILTLKDGEGNLIAQSTTGPFIITDDHKNKESPPQTPGSIPMQLPQYPSGQIYGNPQFYISMPNTSNQELYPSYAPPSGPASRYSM